MHLAGEHTDQVGFELGESGEDVEEHFAHGVGGIVDARPQSQLDAALDQSVGDGARVGNGARQAIQLRHDERIAGPDGGERLVEAGPRAVGPGHAVIGIDALRGNAELFEGRLLGGKVLPVGGAAGIADCDGHGRSVR